MTPTKLLHQIIQLAHNMPDPHVVIFGLRSIDISRIGGKGPTDGMPFRLDTAFDFWDTDKGDVRGIRTLTGLHDWAATWTWSWWEWADREETRPEGDKLLWLLAHIDWAAECYPAFGEFVDEMGYVLGMLTRAHGLDPIRTDRTCPACGSHLQHQVSDAGLSPDFDCPDCGNQYSPEGLGIMQNAVIAASVDQVTREDAVRIFGINRSTLRSWIRRGQLTESDGLISTRQIQKLVGSFS